MLMHVKELDEDRNHVHTLVWLIIGRTSANWT